MERSIRFVCLVAASLAFLTFTFARAEDQPLPQGAVQVQEPRIPRDDSDKSPKQNAGKDGDKKAEATKFVQVKRDQNGKPLSMQTAIVRYVPAKADKAKEGLVIDLVSVVHIADRKYFDKLNTRFEDYDAVLFELVMAKGTKVPKGGVKKGSNPLSMIQEIMTLVLQLDLQTRCIDYTPKNFVHADLSPQELSDIIKKRGDNSLSMILTIAGEVLREQNKMAGKPGQNFDPLTLLTDPKAPSKLKVIMAEQMEQMADGTGLGKTLNQLLIDERNAACMKVLNEQIADGKKKIAIFYGAAHMPDFERRLVEKHGMERQKVIWYDAWDLTPKPVNPFDLLKILD
jgi:hypothetical protein